MLSSVIEEKKKGNYLQKGKRDQCLFYYTTDSFTEQIEKKKKTNYRITFVLNFFSINSIKIIMKKEKTYRLVD